MRVPYLVVDPPSPFGNMDSSASGLQPARERARARTQRDDPAPTDRVSTRRVTDASKQGQLWARVRFPAADGVRALAVACVVAVHGWAAAVTAAGGSTGSLADRLLSHLNVGVAIFFALSGFLLYRPFVARDFALGPHPGTLTYGWRRFLRIFPAYWLALAVLAIVPGASARGGDGVWAIAALQGLQLGSEPHCVVDIQNCRLAHVWSLTVELSFYAALPLYALVVGRFAARRWRLATEAALLATLAVVSTWLASDSATASSPWVTGTVIGHFAPFGAGMFGAVLWARAQAQPTAPRSPATPRAALRPSLPEIAALVAVLSYLALALALPATPFLFSERDRLVMHVGSTLVAASTIAMAAASAGRPVGRLLASRPVRVIGLISYSIFLWHYTFALLATEIGIASPALATAFVAGCTLPVAALSYLLAERPAMRLKRVPPALLARRIFRPAEPISSRDAAS